MQIFFIQGDLLCSIGLHFFQLLSASSNMMLGLLLLSYDLRCLFRYCSKFKFRISNPSLSFNNSLSSVKCCNMVRFSITLSLGQILGYLLQRNLEFSNLIGSILNILLQINLESHSLGSYASHLFVCNSCKIDLT